MIFPFQLVPVKQPAVPLGGIMVRPRPVVWFGLLPSAGGSRVFVETLVDTGADDVVFRLQDAVDLGLNLFSAPSASFVDATGKMMTVRDLPVELTLAAAADHFVRWKATVGFAPIARPVFGFAGGLQHFPTTFDWTAGRFSLVPRVTLPVTESLFPPIERSVEHPV